MTKYIYYIGAIIMALMILTKVQDAQALQIGDKVPDFNANTTKGELTFNDWAEDKWVVLFSHPGDFTPVCTTELAHASFLQPEFAEKNVKLIGLSVDSIEDHKEWIPHINTYKDQIKTNFPGEVRPDLDFPLISDSSLELAKTFGMIHPNANPYESAFGNKSKTTIRSVFIISPDKKVQTILTYPIHVGRNFHEILRTVEALQVADEFKVSIPANWKPGDKVIVPTHIPNDTIEEYYSTKEFTEHQEYLRKIDQPNKRDFKGE